MAASGSLYAQQLFSEVVPLRGVLLGIFFTAVGMFFDPAQVAAAPGVLVLDVAAIVVGKLLIIVLAARFLLGRPLRVSLEAGLSLAQTGEFAFVLLGVAGGVKAGQNIAVVVLRNGQRQTINVVISERR